MMIRPNILQVIPPEKVSLLSRSVNAMYAMAQAIHDVIQRKCPDAFGDMYVNNTSLIADKLPTYSSPMGAHTITLNMYVKL